MGIITKIQSVSDLITNSSSEVFVMYKQDAEYYEDLEGTEGCVYTTPITMDWLHSWEGRNEWEMVCSICNLDRIEVQGEYHKGEYWSYYDDPDEETWNAFLERHKDVIEERIKDLYWVDIEDHFPDACDVNDSARSDALWTDYRH